MKKKIKKSKKSIYLFFPKSFYIIGLLIVVSIIYVFQVGSASNAASQTKVQHDVQTENKVTLPEDSPIHIAQGFDEPLSLEKPYRVLVPQVSIDVAVVHAGIFDGHWEVSEFFANHGQGSAYPGHSGNMVIFAHARPALFLNLQNVVVGNDIYILTDKQWYTYKVTEIKQVTPDQVEVIAPTSDERITLFTCSGVDDENRFIVIGKKGEIPLNSGIRKIY